ncbi:NAD-dependent succinate-semialdehyde dehydrogenase [Amycolatopsis methanolica]|uniref:NAD-dependent succinate-semialdehyde dehydrogenase n=1 Tax=Amycolatopsis methanolica TaxID=1814 RepID=UPI003437B42D
MYKVINPFTGGVEREYEAHTDAGLEKLLTAAHSAYGAWDISQRQRRAEALKRIGDIFLERRDELAEILVREMGKPIREARDEVSLTASIFKYYAENSEAFLADEAIEAHAGGEAVIRKEPVGTLLGIMPWNFPYYQIARFAGPNLVAGNCVLLKPAPQCPESALALAEIFYDAGIPRDAYSTIFATNEQIHQLIADPRIAGVSVTGSERAGSAVAEAAGKNLKKVILELGGSDAFIVLDTDDLDATVDAAVGARVYNAGQMCNAAKRMIVVEQLYDEFVTRFTAKMKSLVVGDPREDGTDLGPLSSVQAADSLLEQIRDAVDRGATVHTGGRRVEGPGAFVEPTVLTDVKPGMRAYTEELFGPAAVIYRVPDADAAVELANSTPYGLGGAVFSKDLDTARQVAARLDTGMVWINSAQGTSPELPFGGTKRSGFGRELGPLGIEEFINKKLVYIPRP